MRILFLAAEATPLVKVGGLGDVAGSLPKALRALGHDVRVVIPGYGAIDWPRYRPRRIATLAVPHAGGEEIADIFRAATPDGDVDLVTGPPIPKDGRIYGAGIGDDGPKFTFFSLAALWSCRALGWQPDVVHANDSHTGPAVYWLGTSGRDDEYFRSAAGLLTIHNLPYMGRSAGRFLGEYGLPRNSVLDPLPGWARDSMLGIGLAAADVLSTVSPTYAREIRTPAYGEGLDGFLRFREDRLAGILNGIDPTVWDPAADEALTERFDVERRGPRAANKFALQEEAGLAPEPGAPLAGVVTRLDSQKGLEIAIPATRRWLAIGGQFVLVGTGDPVLESRFAQLEREFPGRASVRLRFDPAYARRIYAGADTILIPSRYEPCGLTQMIAMRYGAVPVARRTGGLADTVVDAGDPGGNGLLFDDYSPEALWDALERTLAVYSDPGRWRDLQTRGMRTDFSWTRPAELYAGLYRLAIGLRAESFEKS